MTTQPSLTEAIGAPSRAHLPGNPPTPPSTLPGASQRASGDRFLNPWRVVQGQPLKDVVHTVAHHLRSHEIDLHPRQRTRKAADALRWDVMTEAVLCDLAHSCLLSPTSGRLVVPLAHRPTGRGRYATPTSSDTLGSLLAYLQELELVEVAWGCRERREATTIKPRWPFRDLVWRHRVRLSDFGQLLDQETIILTRSERVGCKREKTRMAYEDTPETRLLRADLAAINTYLAKADLKFLTDNHEPVDTSRRVLRRHFTAFNGEPVRFDRGGRLFGGFWQEVKKERRKRLTIDGEEVAELDFSAAFTHIAFARLGLSAPAADDLYAVPGLEALTRKQVKTAWNLQYFTTGKGGTKWPKDVAGLNELDPDTGEVLSGISDGFTPRSVRKAIEAHHPALASVFGTQVGYHLMRLESDIMVRLLLQLIVMGITALPIHDAVAVPRSKAPLVKDLMEAVAIEVIGTSIPVRCT